MMDFRKAMSTCATLSLLWAAPALAEDGACLRVVTFEWKATHTIDPAQLVENSDFVHILSAYEFLTTYDNDFVVKPQLAQSWESSEDGKSWVFTLREGVTFHSGKELTADDVVYTVRRVLDPATASMAASELSGLKPENVTAKSKYEVSIVFDKPVVELPLIMGNRAMGIIESGATHDQLMKASYGTGPFLIKDFDSTGARSILQANPDYWQAGKPKMPCIELSGSTDPLARAATIQTNAADIVTSADPVTIPTLEADENVTLYPAQNAILMMFAMQTDKPPFDDNRVRTAMKLVVDRVAMANLVTVGVGTPGNDNASPLTSPFSFQTTPIPQDIEKAKALLAEAGHSDLTVDLYTGAQDLVPGSVVMAQAYKEMAAPAGITVNILTAPNASYWDDTYMKHPFFFAYWYARHPSTSYNFGYRTGGRFNETNWNNKTFDDLLDAAAGEVDPGKRTVAYQEAGKMLTEEGGAIIPVFAPLVAAVRKTCTGFVPHVETRIAFADIDCK
ncbi:ABC transporter substrate-binding protein [Ensifer soli]|uniref:ABC transporter substrate-binding protein n=1 Tax=Ciceribacter sp. sgz301302 TaxID=3342379 RepID=UPI0035BB0BAE